MKFCTGCGNRLGVGRFCTNCGRPVAGDTLPQDGRAPRRPRPGRRPRSTAAGVHASSGAALPALHRRAVRRQGADRPGRRPPAPPTTSRLPTTPLRAQRRPGISWLAVALTVVILMLVAVIGGLLLFAGGDDEQAGDPASGDDTAQNESSPPPSEPSSPSEPSGPTDPAPPPATAAGRGPVRHRDRPDDREAQPRHPGQPGPLRRPQHGRRRRRRPAGGCPATAPACELTFTLAGPAELTEVGLINGYAKRAGKLDWYAGNRRVLSVEWVFDDGTVVAAVALARRRNLQTVQIDPVTTSTVVLRLVAVSAPGQGPSARDYTAISEVSLFGTTS